MKKVLFYISIFISSFIFSQTNINELERLNGVWITKKTKEKFNGTFVEFFPSGKKMGTCEVKDGLPDGQRLIYFENGNISQDKMLKKGVYEGKNSEFFENGKIKQEGMMKSGKSDGIWKIYYENGNLQAQLTFVNGEEKGDYFQYDQNGKLVAQYYIIDGKESYSKEFLDLNSKAMDLLKKGKFKEAIVLYDKAIVSNPTVAITYYNRGVCKANSLDFEAAIKDYDKAIEIDSEYKEAYRNRGIAKINILNTSKSNGNEKLTPEQTKSACEDFHKAAQLGDKSVDNEDMIYIYCKKKK
ncbi:MAG: tetratricopeptide repeat protein [Fluviicola sp.]|nr:tetratricopeptide repeat protein [Fluviicola sp.]